MKQQFCNTVCLVILVVLTSCLGKVKHPEVKLITAAEMQAILAEEDVQIVDVRTPEEYRELRVVNAQNIDYHSPTFDEDISKLDREKPVIVYCRGGNRSSKCAKKLKEAGFKKVYDLEGGLSKWKHSELLQLEIKS